MHNYTNSMRTQVYYSAVCISKIKRTMYVGHVFFVYIKVYPAVSAHCLAFMWQQMCLSMMRV